MPLMCTYDSSTGELFRDGTRLTVLEGFASAFDGNFYSLYSVSSNGFSLVARGSSVDSSRFLCNNPPELGAIYVNGTLLDSNEVTITYPENLTITVDAYDVENGDDLTMELFIQNDSQGTAPTTHSVSYVTNNSSDGYEVNARLVITDSHGATTESTFRVRIENPAPPADTEAPSVSINEISVTAGQSFTFNANVSDNSDGPLTYEWSLDGITRNGQSFTHTHGQAGLTKTIRLRVTDAAGNVGTDEFTYVTQEPAPAPASITLGATELVPTGNDSAINVFNGSSTTINIRGTGNFDVFNGLSGSTVEITWTEHNGREVSITATLFNPQYTSIQLRNVVLNSGRSYEQHDIRSNFGDSDMVITVQ